MALTLNACVTIHSEEIKAPDGSTNHLVTCQNVNDCYKEAGQICSGPYSIIKQYGDVIADAKGNTQTIQKVLVGCGI